MGANDLEGRGQPILELPEALVLAHVVPRLPWYTRPVCRALSKSWRALMDTKNPELDLRTRVIQLPLLRGRFLFCTFDKQIFISDKGACRMNGYQVQPHWRKLPAIRRLALPSPYRATMVANSGFVYAWPQQASADGKEETLAYKLDIGSAACTWKTCSCSCSFPYALSPYGVAFNGKFYEPRLTLEDSVNPRLAVLVHDMSTDTCRQVEKWHPDELSIFLRSTDSGALVEGMYGIVRGEDDTKLQIVMYDAVSDSWRTWEEVPLPESQWRDLVDFQLLNAECFEPVPETGSNNVVGITHYDEKLYWFNSSLGNRWVCIDFGTPIEGMRLESFVYICSSMYAIFWEQKDNVEDGKEEEEDGNGLPDLFYLVKMVLMKGRIIVASKSVAWEKVHEIGFFDARHRRWPIVFYCDGMIFVYNPRV